MIYIYNYRTKIIYITNEDDIVLNDEKLLDEAEYHTLLLQDPTIKVSIFSQKTLNGEFNIWKT